ncbi:MAG: isochorismatase family protein, partial [Planctomycetes bacterium]|nr:isochorismatase family protein [Planctomycetota bacterium]
SPSLADSVLIIVDVQDKLLRLLNNFDKTLRNLKLVTKAFYQLKLPIVATEHNPQVFGDTEKELRTMLLNPPLVKFTFSCFGIDEFSQMLQYLKRKNLIITGYEAHICVLQTTVDALKNGYKVFAVTDAIGAVNDVERRVAFKRYSKEGAILTTTESILYELVKDSKTDEFKSVLHIIKELRA